MIAANSDGGVNETGAAVGFRLLPHFYQRAGSSLLSFFACVAAALTAYPDAG